MPKGKAMAQKAIELDPALAGGYVAMAIARANFDRHLSGAEKDIEKALELDPNSTVALGTHSSFLAFRGRIEEAVKVQRRALDLDPLSPAWSQSLPSGLPAPAEPAGNPENPFDTHRAAALVWPGIVASYARSEAAGGVP